LTPTSIGYPEAPERETGFAIRVGGNWKRREGTPMGRLRRSDCAGPGIARVRRGGGFSYRDEEGATIRDSETLGRVLALAIPPAWTEVWICPHPNGHLQATGIDAAGRKQYLYHERWRQRRDQQKFDEMLEFARSLPRLRRLVTKDLERRGLVRERVLACAIRLLDLGLFRIGGEQYAEENGTFGLATLRRRHLTFERGVAVFDFRAKGARRHVQQIGDEPTVKVLRSLARRNGGGRELLAFYERKRWRDVTSSDINDYLKASAGGDFSAKDFRTWNATVLAAVALAARVADERRPDRARRRRLANSVVRDVAGYLGNTPAVCRASYIDPRLFDRFDSNATITAPVEEAMKRAGPHEFPARERIERAVVRLLE
jgi:DNA topoisomerase-1